MQHLPLEAQQTKKYWVLRVLTALLLILPTLFLAVIFADAFHLDPSAEGAGLAMAALAIVFIAMWGICLIPYALSLILSVVGLVLSCKRNEKGRAVGQKVYFGLMIAAPAVIAALEFLLFTITVNSFSA